MKKNIVILLIFIISCTGSMSISAKKETTFQNKTEVMEIPLKWKPTETNIAIDSVNLKILQKYRFNIIPFNDCRQDTGIIGKNILRGSVRLVKTKTVVPDWCEKQIVSTLKNYGLTITEDSAHYTISACIHKFYVEEKKRYVGETELRIVVNTLEGQQKWAAILSAESENWGRTFSAENYYECLSNSLLFIIESFLKNTQLGQAVQN